MSDCHWSFPWLSGPTIKGTGITMRSFASKVEESANGARYKSQGQARSEAERVAPGKYTNERFRPERPKYAPYYALSGLGEFDSGTRGDALRACPWLSYSAPSALDLPVRPTFEAKSTTISDRSAHRCAVCLFASSRRADLVERLSLQRFSLPSHQLRSGRHRHSRLPEGHGKQSWSRGVIWHPVATAMVISR